MSMGENLGRYGMYFFGAVLAIGCFIGWIIWG